MLAYLSASAEIFASSLIQFSVGIALALLAYRLSVFGRIASRLQRASGAAAPGAVFVAALCGAILPLGPAGAVPIAGAVLASGLGTALAIPFLVSDLLFNPFAAFTDPTFIWRTGYLRLLFALVAGSAAGLIALRAKASSPSLLREISLPPRPGAATRFALSGAGVGAVCLAAGALLDTAFKRYALGALVGFAYASPATSFVPEMLSTLNVVNPFFLLAMRILALLTDFSALAALALILKPKGILAYFAYFAAWAALLGLSAFLKV
jgi:hypothetical protein